MTGREPMNPQRGQYALAGTLDGWTELSEQTRRQRRALRLAYSGRTPWVYGKYGRRQWAAPLPWTRLVVKDPFALLSIPTVTRTTGAQAVLVFRHPAAALVSYRRMGWQPNLDVVRALQSRHRAGHGGTQQAPLVPHDGEVGQAESIACFWSALHEIALDHLRETDDVVIVSHEELSGGGAPAARALFERLGLRWSRRAQAEMDHETGRNANSRGDTNDQLHRLDRAPEKVAIEWRGELDPVDMQVVEEVSSAVLTRLHAARMPVTS